MEVKSCRADDPLFLQLKREFYKEEGVPPVPEPAGPHLHTCFVVTEEGRPLARAALFNNPALSGMKQPCAQVGSFEARDNQAAVNLLFQEIESEARKLGAEVLIGPMNGSTWNSYRFYVKNEQPFFTEFTHPQYYLKLWKEAGFEELAEYYSAKSESIQETILKPREKPFPLKIRNIDLGNYEGELREIHTFCQEAFANNFLFSPISETEFLKLYQPLKNYIKPQLVMLAEVNGKLVGLAFGLPNHLDSSGKSMVIKTLARSPQRAYRGLGGFLANQIFLRSQELGYHEIIHAFMLKNASSTPVSQNLHGRHLRDYVLLKKDL